MEIRGDLKEVEGLITRLVLFGGEFRSKDSQWAHLKNNEDFDQVHKITDFHKKYKIERIYSDGRDIAGFMASSLEAINYDFTQYPTLTKIVHRFEKTWVYEDLSPIVEDAKSAAEELQFNNWAFSQMLTLFNEQTELLKTIAETLESLKKSILYIKENGGEMKEQESKIHIENVNNSNINLNSENVTQTIKTNNIVFVEMFEAIDSSEIKNKEELKKAVKEMETESASGSIASTYKKFISLAADHVTVFAPFLPVLATLL
jgi:hypothetical protein